MSNDSFKLNGRVYQLLECTKTFCEDQHVEVISLQRQNQQIVFAKDKYLVNRIVV